LLLFKEVGDREVHLAEVDWITGTLKTPPKSLERGYLSRATNPSWSPNGRELAYVAEGGRVLAVRSVETGEVRKVPHGLQYMREPQWNRDGLSLLVIGRDSKGRDGIFRVNPTNGAVTLLSNPSNPPTLGAFPRWSAAGGSIVYFDTSKEAFIERQIQSGAERVIFQRAGIWRECSISPDGRWLAVQTGDGGRDLPGGSLLLVSMTTGEARELLKLNASEHWGPLGTTKWMPDGTAILKVKETGSKSELLSITLDGAVRSLSIDPALWLNGSSSGLDRGFSISPDGRQIAFLTGKNAAEMWALENFLPARPHQ